MRTSIKRVSAQALVLSLALFAAPAFAEEEEEGGAETDPPPAITITGAAIVTSDYRFRGISQTDEEPAIQGTININHESGLYAGIWASNVSDYVTGPGSDAEFDLYAGFRKTVGGATLDFGVLYYVYSGAGNVDTDFFEPYGNVSGTLGPVTAKLGFAYAPEQDAIGDEDNIYVYGDVAGAIPGSPVTLKAHLGYNSGDSFLTLAVPDATGQLRGVDYLDYSIGADFVYKNLTLGVAFVDTDLSRADEAAFFFPHDNKIISETVVVTLTAAF